MLLCSTFSFSSCSQIWLFHFGLKHVGAMLISQLLVTDLKKYDVHLNSFLFLNEELYTCLLTYNCIFALFSWVCSFKLCPNLLDMCPFCGLDVMSLFSVIPKPSFVQPQVCISLTDSRSAAYSCGSWITSLCTHFLSPQGGVALHCILSPLLHCPTRPGFLYTSSLYILEL